MNEKLAMSCLKILSIFHQSRYLPTSEKYDFLVKIVVFFCNILSTIFANYGQLPPHNFFYQLLLFIRVAISVNFSKKFLRHFENSHS